MELFKASREDCCDFCEKPVPDVMVVNNDGEIAICQNCIDFAKSLCDAYLKGKRSVNS